MLTDDYRVNLEQFEGPLDLLLFLIRRDEIEIADIPVARIAEQYLAFLGQIERIDIDVAGEFLVMAATLMEIKSRMLAPTPPGQVHAARQSDEAPEDPRAELVRQLLEYKRFRDAAGALEQRFTDWSGRFPAGSASVEKQPEPEALEDEPVELGEIELFDLISAFQKIMEAVNFDRLGVHEVSYDDTPIELHAEDIVDRLRRETTPQAAGELELSKVLVGRTRSEMIGLFLAVLDLVRHSRLHVRQDRIGGSILLSLSPEAAGATSESSIGVAAMNHQSSPAAGPDGHPPQGPASA